MSGVVVSSVVSGGSHRIRAPVAGQGWVLLTHCSLVLEARIAEIREPLLGISAHCRVQPPMSDLGAWDPGAALPLLLTSTPNYPY